MRRFLGIVALLTMGGDLALAGFVVPYTLRIGPAENPELFTVLVFLPEQYRKQWGSTDDLWKLLPRNDHGRRNKFAKQYLQTPYQWYLKQIEEHPELYGEDTKQMRDMLIAHHGIDPDVGAVVITEHRQLTKPVALLRIAGADKGGLLPTNRQFFEDLQGAVFPQADPAFRQTLLAHFQAMNVSGPATFDVTRATDTTPHWWVEGENVEFKNFAMEHQYRGRLMRFLFHTVWAHQMFSYGRLPIPENITEWPDGSPMSSRERQAMGRRISTIWLGTYGKTLSRFYRKFGFRVWRKLELPHWKQPIFLMRATARKYAKAVRLLKPQDDAPEDYRYWLVHDDEMSVQIRRFNCADQVALGLAM